MGMKHPIHSLFAALLLVLGTASAEPAHTSGNAQAEPAASDRAALPPLNIEKYELRNGLTVLLDKTDRLPVVAVELRYLVGSSYERKGRSGFAHLFEHLMFQGSQNHDKEYFAPFEPIGGAVNGTTSQDRTNYYERVPANYLELALWLESDRMQNLLPVLTQAKLDNQRDVVKNERRQRYENQPYGMAWVHLTETLFPESHPYHRSVIGSHKDLSAASLQDVREFFQEYYAPANAVLTISGSFDPAQAKRLVDKYFGGIPAGKRAKPPSPEAPKLDGIKHVTTTDSVKLPRVYLAWHTPALFAPGDAELDLLSSLLADGKTSRLYQPLVYKNKVAQSVSAYQVSLGLGSFYVIEATAAPGVKVEQLSKELLKALETALKTPPSADELKRALNGYKKGFYSRVEGATERAQLLSTYYHLAGQADYLKEDLARYLTASAQDVYGAGRKWLVLDRYARIDVVPGDKPGQAQKASALPAAPKATATQQGAQ